MFVAVIIGCRKREQKPAPEETNPVVISVESHDIRLAEFRLYAEGYLRDVEKQQLKRPMTTLEKFEYITSAADGMILRVLLEIEAQRRGEKVSEDQVDAFVNQRMIEVLGPARGDSQKEIRDRKAGFEAYLKSQFGLDPETFRAWARQDIIYNRIMPRLVDELGARQDADLDKKALEIMSRLEAGEPFESLAKENPGAGGPGADSDFTPVMRLPEEIRTALSGMEPGQISAPVKTSDGRTIIWLRERGKTLDSIRISRIIIGPMSDEELVIGWLGKRKTEIGVEFPDPYLAAYDYYTRGDEAARPGRVKGDFDPQVSIDLWEKAERSDPPMPELDRAYAAYFRGRAYFNWAFALNQSGNNADRYLQAALRAYERARVLAQAKGFDEPEFILAQGEALARLGEKDEALQTLRLASELAGDNSQIRVRLRWLFQDLGADGDAARETVLMDGKDKKAP